MREMFCIKLFFFRKYLKLFENFENLEKQRFENLLGTILSTIFTPT